MPVSKKTAIAAGVTVAIVVVVVLVITLSVTLTESTDMSHFFSIAPSRFSFELEFTGPAEERMELDATLLRDGDIVLLTIKSFSLQTNGAGILATADNSRVPPSLRPRSLKVLYSSVELKREGERTFVNCQFALSSDGSVTIFVGISTIDLLLGDDRIRFEKQSFFYSLSDGIAPTGVITNGDATIQTVSLRLQPGVFRDELILVRMVLYKREGLLFLTFPEASTIDVSTQPSPIRSDTSIPEIFRPTQASSAIFLVRRDSMNVRNSVLPGRIQLSSDGSFVISADSSPNGSFVPGFASGFFSQTVGFVQNFDLSSPFASNFFMSVTGPIAPPAVFTFFGARLLNYAFVNFSIPSTFARDGKRIQNASGSDLIDFVRSSKSIRSTVIVFDSFGGWRIGIYSTQNKNFDVSSMLDPSFVFPLSSTFEYPSQMTTYAMDV